MKVTGKESFQKTTLICTLACIMGGQAALAQDASTSNDDSEVSTTSDYTETADIEGLNVNRTPIKELVSQPFLLYNVGTGKYLTRGGWWGMHATLSEVPQVFWIDRKADSDKVNANLYVRYPEAETDGSGKDLTLKALITPLTEKTTLQVGSKEGKASHAIYKKAAVLDKDGNVKQNLLTSDWGGGGKFQSDATDLDFANGDQIQVTLDLSTCSTANSDENVLSLGTDIANWQTGSNVNIHTYYFPSQKQLDVDPVQKGFTDGDKVQLRNITGEVTLTFNKDGFFVGDEHVLYSQGLTVPYTSGKEGDFVYFKTDENGNYLTDSSNNRIICEKTDKPCAPLMMKYENYLYSDTPTSNSIFIYSNIAKDQATVQKNEGKYLAFAPYDQAMSSLGKGAIGAYIDRAIKSKLDVPRAQWTATYSRNLEDTYSDCYLSLTMPYDIETGKGTTEHTYYLYATGSYITGKESSKSDKQHYYYEIDKDCTGTFENEYTSADLLATNPDEDTENRDYATWRLLPISSYIQMLENAASNLQRPIDVSYLIGDNDFSRENGALSSWTSTFSSSDLSYTAPLRIGYDGYYKTSPADTKYYTSTTDDSDNSSNAMRINHSRYMCAAVQNGGEGKLYQDVSVHHPGWYIVRCQGMTNIDSKLFAQAKDNSTTAFGTELTTPLTHLTSEDLLRIRAAAGTQYGWSSLHWPYDGNMPMYNSAVEMNDPYLPTDRTAHYQSQLLIYIGAASQDAPATIRLGVDVQKAEGSTIATADEWTAVDKFRILFAGNGEDELYPNLVLDEDSTTLCYLDLTNHTYQNKPLHLNRTFAAGNWNTLMLPVSLSEAQCKEMFGSDMQLARLDCLEGSSAIFRTVQESEGTLLQAYTPYIIKTSKAHGDRGEYDVPLVRRDDANQYIMVTSPEHHFYTTGVTLLTPNGDNGSQGYNFGGIAYGSDNWQYVVKADEKFSEAKDAEDGSRLLTFLGTLCKTYTTTDEGKNEMIASRPTLQDGKSYYMNANNTIQRRGTKNPYGLKGFRCWFTYEEGTEAQGAKPFTISIDGISDPTSIDDLQRADGITVVEKYAHAIYNLNGQKVATTQQIGQLPAGIYIVDGKKYIVNK